MKVKLSNKVGFRFSPKPYESFVVEADFEIVRDINEENKEEELKALSDEIQENLLKIIDDKSDSYLIATEKKKEVFKKAFKK